MAIIVVSPDCAAGRCGGAAFRAAAAGVRVSEQDGVGKTVFNVRKTSAAVPRMLPNGLTVLGVGHAKELAVRDIARAAEAGAELESVRTVAWVIGACVNPNR